MAVIVLVSLTVWLAVGRRHSSESAAPPPGELVQSVAVSGIRVDLRSLQGHMRQGRNELVVEFRSTATGALIAAGAVRLAATMSMPGMATPADVTIGAPNPPGRFPVTAEFGMAGAWRFTIAWDGPGGHQSTSFDGDVR